MTDEFTGKTALVTEGGTGIGRASAVALAAKGCSVTVAGRTLGTLQETVDEIVAAGGQASLVACDVSDESSVVEAVKVALVGTGKLDFAVNSAGVSGGESLKPTAEYDTALFDKILAIDLRGTFLSMKYELRQMKAQGFGAIVNLGSGASLVGVAGFSGYAAAKHGVAGLTETAALDYGADGIRINAIAAGLVDTPLVASGRARVHGGKNRCPSDRADRGGAGDCRCGGLAALRSGQLRDGRRRARRRRLHSAVTGPCKISVSATSLFRWSILRHDNVSIVAPWV
jgi:NAD(P)-dependent dehydrogenase (short-subunit alcohol dehydrogenase family)